MATVAAMLELLLLCGSRLGAVVADEVLDEPGRWCMGIG